MLKLKNFRYLFLVMIFAFAGQDMWGYYSWFSFQVNVKAKIKTEDGTIINKPEAGYVYAKLEKNSSEKENRDELHSHPNWPSNVNSFSQSTTLHAIAKPYFKFLYWTKEDGTIIPASETEQSNGKATITSTATIRCYYGANGSSDSNHAKSHTTVAEQYGTYVNTFNYYAIFEAILPSIAVESNNEEIGRAICSKEDNKEGDEVTLKAYCVDYDTKFLGWELNGEIVSRDNPYTLTVSNTPTGPEETLIYKAVFENGYNFHRIRNYVTKNYLNAISDEGSAATLVSGGDITSLQLKSDDLNDVLYEAGSIVDIYYARIPNDTRYYYDYFVQGAKASKYYDFDPDDPNNPDNKTDGVFIRMPYDAKTYTNTWAFATSNEGGMRFTDDNGTAKITMGERPESQWYIECIDKDLETKENYFSLDPEKLVQVGDKYYTTLRTSWSILIDPERTKPYIVTSVDEENGTFEMEPLEGNIIPAGTPVIIETSSTDMEANRMVPTTTTATQPTNNLLESSEKYFPNQSVASSANYKALMVNGNGQLAFGGNPLTTVNGNEAYMRVPNEIILKPEIQETTLADLLSSGDTKNTYSVTDLTCVYVQDNVLYCKDDNKALNKSVKAAGEIDYIKATTGFQQGYWDQSNWIAVVVPEGSIISVNIPDHRLNNVIGKLTKTVNPEFNAEKMPEAGAENDYTENTYITCNFSGEHQHGVINGEEQDVFFVAPKPMEIAQVEWAMWDYESGMFVMPRAAVGTGLQGAFLPDFSMLNTTPVPSDGYGYHFPALIKVTETTSQSSAPVLRAGNSSTWTVFPLEWNNDTPTAIDNLQATKTATKVTYYNLMGVASDVPHPGINIVVTEFSDGSRTTTKVVR